MLTADTGSEKKKIIKILYISNYIRNTTFGSNNSTNIIFILGIIAEIKYICILLFIYFLGRSADQEYNFNN